MAGAKSAAILESVGREIRDNPPKALQHTRIKFGARRAQKQRVAILLNKARKAGASIRGAPGKARH